MISLYKNYWKVGFATKLYDFLTPQAYLDSLTQIANEVNGNNLGRVLDVGCGSGLLLNTLDRNFFKSGEYIGCDRLVSGLTEVKNKSMKLGLKNRTRVMAFDLENGIPVASQSIDTVVAHFSIYTLSEPETRKSVYRQIFKILKPKGKFFVTNPSKEYKAKNIIKESLESSKLKVGNLVLMIRQFILYPLTLALGLRYIEKQLKSGVWHASSLEEFCQDLEDAGFEIEKKSIVYGGGAYMLVCKKN